MLLIHSDMYRCIIYMVMAGLTYLRGIDDWKNDWLLQEITEYDLCDIQVWWDMSVSQHVT